jgi:hypothetical protein
LSGEVASYVWLAIITELLRVLRHQLHIHVNIETANVRPLGLEALIHGKIREAGGDAHVSMSNNQ